MRSHRASRRRWPSGRPNALWRRARECCTLRDGHGCRDRRLEPRGRVRSGARRLGPRAIRGSIRPPDAARSVDKTHLLAAIELARRARENGNHPFGALLVDARGVVVLEAENSVLTESDCTNHAELNLVRAASRMFDQASLRDCTLYTSTEPCAMCAGGDLLVRHRARRLRSQQREPDGDGGRSRQGVRARAAVPRGLRQGWTKRRRQWSASGRGRTGCARRLLESRTRIGLKPLLAKAQPDPGPMDRNSIRAAPRGTRGRSARQARGRFRDSSRGRSGPRALQRPEGSPPATPPSATSSAKNCSKPAGEMISSRRAGSSPAFQKVCHWSRGLKIRSPGPPIDDIVAQECADASLEHEAVLVLSRVAVERCSQGARGHGVLDEREAAAGLAAVDHEPDTDAPEKARLAVLGPEHSCS